MKRRLMIAALTAALTLALANAAPAGEQAGAPQKKGQQTEQMYGYGMMTDAERNAYREKMRGAQTAQERQAMRDEHRKLMDERMKEQGMGPRGQMGQGPHGPGPGGRGPGPRGPATTQ